ncbi:hypothetical protein [Streptomyces peucetius]|uniref:Translation initiation factor IF-2 n=1 Tax=Streptomyces peucetius TaxID=1950 RepID=A0ABY6ICM7_STRPE|nr:hypothetical protein [Streptomyces peucetius]UYQ64752.1 hypothetical protein OGH68_27060 [Streptomyces peucetius]
MSDEKQPTPELTPEQLQQQERAEQQQDVSEIKQQYAGTDMMYWLNDILPFGLNVSTNYLGTSNFEDRKLNEMLDLLDSANPADLENAGDTLEKAKTALNKAAKELSDFVTSTDWKGEAALAFESYGQSLVTYAWDVGRYANAVGAQMKVASTGLASVRNSKPPRDDRADPRKPEAFPEKDKTPDNPEYQKAVKAEKDRQEAINLMNRLASYYTVSHASLASEEMPKPPKRLDVAVPAPSGGIQDGGTSGTGTARSESVRSTSQPVGTEAELQGYDPASPAKELRPVTSGTPSDTSMQIDTVTAPPAPTTTPNTPSTSPVTSPPTSQNGPLPPMPGPTGPIRNSTSRTGGPPVARATGGPGVDKAGRPLTTGTPGPATGRPTGPTGGPRVSGGGTGEGRTNSPVGRPTATGPGGGGQPGRGGQPTGQQPMTGRAATTNQPMAGRATSAPSTGVRGGRSDAIVGGTPQRTTAGPAGARIPRGTVVGGEGTAPGRSPASRPGQAGVIGANPGSGAQRTTGRGPAGANGVVGTPRNAGQGRPGVGGYTTGGAAVVGGRRSRRPAGDDEQERRASARPDHLAEDEETWAARRREPAPPVID